MDYNDRNDALLSNENIQQVINKLIAKEELNAHNITLDAHNVTTDTFGQYVKTKAVLTA